MKEVKISEYIISLLGQLHKNTAKIQENALEALGITSGEYRLLAQIYKSGKPVSQRDIAAALRVDKALIARQTASAEQKGFILRAKKPSNKRENILCLTDNAKKILPRLLNIHGDAVEKMFKDIPENMLESFSGVLEALIKNTKDILKA